MIFYKEDIYFLTYDAENRLVQIKRGTDIQATYYYDGDGNRVKTVVGSTTTTYIGSYLERECINTTCTMKSYYSAAGQRVALRKGDGTLYFLLTDHLGSTAITATSSGGRYSELRYYPWGGTRYTYGTTPTSYRYTGQREAEVGLYFYGARFYDPYLPYYIPTITPSPMPMCMLPPEDTSIRDLLAYLRVVTGELDPAMPDEFTGTNLGYLQAIEKAAELVNMFAPGNPYSQIITISSPFIPFIATGYDFIYDQATNTGEYSTISLPAPTPLQFTHTIFSLLAILPLFIP